MFAVVSGIVLKLPGSLRRSAESHSHREANHRLLHPLPPVVFWWLGRLLLHVPRSSHWSRDRRSVWRVQQIREDVDEFVDALPGDCGTAWRPCRDWTAFSMDPDRGSIAALHCRTRNSCDPPELFVGFLRPGSSFGRFERHGIGSIVDGGNRVVGGHLPPRMSPGKPLARRIIPAPRLTRRASTASFPQPGRDAPYPVEGKDDAPGPKYKGAS